MPKAKILIVDDEQDIREVTKSFLSRRDFLCFTAGDEPEALRQAEKEKPDIVFLDMRLKDVSGLDLLPKVKALLPQAKIIMVTGVNDQETVDKAKALGAADFLNKPFSASFLNDFLIKLIGTK